MAALPCSIASAVSLEIFLPPTMICGCAAGAGAAALGAGSSCTAIGGLRLPSWRLTLIFLVL
jgi:hypothetical protein